MHTKGYTQGWGELPFVAVQRVGPAEAVLSLTGFALSMQGWKTIIIGFPLA